MEKGRLLHLLAGIFLLCASILIIRFDAGGVKQPDSATQPSRADMITIDTLAPFGKLELPPVAFPHDKHTEALLKEKKDCKTCHSVEDGKISLAFKGIKPGKADGIKEIYHSSCIGCHMGRAAADKPTGPLDGLCRACHIAPRAVSQSQPVDMDKVLHFRHIDSKNITSTAAEKDNCAQCHHEYDKNAKKIFYARGKESTCRYCHGENRVDGVRSMRQAAHQQCVTCHLDLADKGVKDRGPYLCAGCHGAEGHAAASANNRKVMAGLPDGKAPRLKREQPDLTLLSSNAGVEGPENTRPRSMNPVAFDHKSHEERNNNCRVCHHASMDSCGKCHTVSGAREGNFVRIEEAMHLAASGRSCSGCHAAKQSAVNCSGCHGRMNKASTPDNNTCRQCHMEVPSDALPDTGSLTPAPPLSRERKSMIAEILLKSRGQNSVPFAIEDIPEKVSIKELAAEYEPAVMPHRKIVLTLMNGMKDNSLAAYFHGEQGTVCQSCHHRSPASKQPPHCGNCHGKPFDPRQPNRPGLKAAFHEQCMGCHKALGVPKPSATACAECHKEKK